MATKKPREYFARYMKPVNYMLYPHIIEKAILQAIGERNLDKEIKKIWKRVLNK